MRIFLTALFACALWFSTCAAAGDGELSRIVVFGDSLTDPGNAFVLTHQVFVPPYQLIPDFPYARGGHHFSNGKTWVEQLARGLDMADSTCPALAARGRCSNYAVGGALARPARISSGECAQCCLGTGDPSSRSPGAGCGARAVGRVQ